MLLSDVISEGSINCENYTGNTLVQNNEKFLSSELVCNQGTYQLLNNLEKSLIVGNEIIRKD